MSSPPPLLSSDAQGAPTTALWSPSHPSSLRRAFNITVVFVFIMTATAVLTKFQINEVSLHPTPLKSETRLQKNNFPLHVKIEERNQSGSNFTTQYTDQKSTQRELEKRNKTSETKLDHNGTQKSQSLPGTQNLTFESLRNESNRTGNFTTFGIKMKIQECPMLADGFASNASQENREEWVPQNFTASESLAFVRPGGIYSPRDCLQRQVTAVLIPNFHMEDKAKSIVKYLHYFLQRQHKAYILVIATQATGPALNRAAMINIAVVEISKRYPVDCIILHDIDSFPLNWRNDYSCTPGAVRQLLTSRDTENFKPFYPAYMGGVTAIWKEDFYRVNGMSNLYWGWGGEDDDLGTRVKQTGLNLVRSPDIVGRYKHEHRGKRKRNPLRGKLQAKTKQRFRRDGLSNLKYKLISFTSHPLYTNITAKILNDPKDAKAEI